MQHTFQNSIGPDSLISNIRTRSYSSDLFRNTSDITVISPIGISQIMELNYYFSEFSPTGLGHRRTPDLRCINSLSVPLYLSENHKPCCDDRETTLYQTAYTYRSWSGMSGTPPHEPWQSVNTLTQYSQYQTDISVVLPGFGPTSRSSTYPGKLRLKQHVGNQLFWMYTFFRGPGWSLVYSIPR